MPPKRTTAAEPCSKVDGSKCPGNCQPIEIDGPRSAFTVSMSIIFFHEPPDIGSSFMQQKQRFMRKFSRPVALWHESMGHVSLK